MYLRYGRADCSLALDQFAVRSGCALVLDRKEGERAAEGDFSFARWSADQHHPDGIGPGRIRRQRQQADLAVDACQVLLDVGMEMHHPIVQSDGDHIRLRVMLLDMIEEATTIVLSSSEEKL